MTKHHYYSYFQRFLCYVYQIQLLTTRLKEQTIDIIGLQLTTIQCTIIQYVQTRFITLSNEVEALFNSPLIAQSIQNLIILVENLFQLYIMFQTNLYTNRVSSYSTIVYYSGVLGIHLYELAFRGTYDYMPYLLALIQVSQLLILEYSLLLQAYQYLMYLQSNQTYYSNQLQRLQQIYTKYLF